MRTGTRVTRAGLPEMRTGRPILPGPEFAATWPAPGDPELLPYTYGRFHNPTWTNYEAALAELEGGPAVLFASGMAAIAAVLGTVLAPGDLLVLPDDCYYTTGLLAGEDLARLGIRVHRMTAPGRPRPEDLVGARLLWIETPANPGLEVRDIAELVEEAHRAGAFVAVDNTTATVLGQQPLVLGADISVSSDSKATTGHGDLILGHAAARDAEVAGRLRAWRTRTGAVPGPMEAWLAHRALATLELRLERQDANALAVARYLQGVASVRDVRYPGLPGDPAHAVAVRQMRHFGGLVRFTLADRAAAERFLSACRLIIEATSFGAVHTTAERRARWGGDAIDEGLIRLSVGCEDAADLVDDLRQALSTVGE